jgi:hypothetical protein
MAAASMAAAFVAAGSVAAAFTAAAGIAEFVVLPGAARALVFGHDRHQLWHVVHGFLSMPPRRDV